MGNKLLDGMKEDENITLTENLAKTYKSSLSDLVDFFGQAGAIRDRSQQEAINYFTKAHDEDPLLALRCLFYLRDIRGGQGERLTFRRILAYIGDAYPEYIAKNVQHIPEYGRWDDLFALIGTRAEPHIAQLIREQWEKDIHSERPSLLAKWLPSRYTSSDATRALAKIVKGYLGLHSAQYRKALSNLRAKIKIVERDMCAKRWGDIEYERVPSYAGKKYRKAFLRNDEERYREFLGAVERGEKTIKAKTLFPYDLVRLAWDRYDQTIDLQWKNLPNYCDTDDNALVICDTSGSMFQSLNPRPIDVSISLAIYFAERNKGAFHGYFLGFSGESELLQIRGRNLFEKVNNLSKAKWAMNTNLQAAFDRILNTAITRDVPPEEMPTRLFVISDMEFDQATSGSGGYGWSYHHYQNRSVTNFESIKRKYEQSGYTMPTLVFWNVSARQNQSPVTINDKGVWLVSGCSASTFKNLMKSKAPDAVELMLEVLNSDRYQVIEI